MIVDISISEDALKLPVIKGHMRSLASPFYVHAVVKGRHIWIMLSGDNLKYFKTDLMSGPEGLKEELELKREDFPLATVPHDWLFAFATVFDADGNEIRITRNEGDLLMMEILTFCGCPDWKIQRMYKFLKRWSWIAWCRHRILGFFHIKGHTW